MFASPSIKYSIFLKTISKKIVCGQAHPHQTLPKREVINPTKKIPEARVRNIKRIHLLADLIKQVDFPIKWIHIGSENLKSTDITVDFYLKCKEEIKLKNAFYNGLFIGMFIGCIASCVGITVFVFICL